MKQYLIIDDHVAIRTGIRFVLFEKYNASEIHEASDGAGAIEKLSNNFYDLVIMDIQMPDTDTLRLMNQIRTEFPAIKVLIYSMSSEKIHAKRFMKAGAMGFLSKDAPLEEIIRAIDTVSAGRRYISESVAEIFANDSYTRKGENPFDDLSKREFEIARLLLSGQTLTEISTTLQIQTSTVGTHKQRLFEKLSITNLLELKDLATSYNL